MPSSAVMMAPLMKWASSSAIPVQRTARRRLPAAATVCGLVQATVLPPLALYLLLDRVAHLPADGTPAKVLLSVLAITTINACLALLNVLALHALVLTLSVGWQAWVQGSPHLFVTAAIALGFKGRNYSIGCQTHFRCLV